MRISGSFCVALAACSPAGSPEVVERCSITVCGSNSPTIDHYSFHELNLDALPNRRGFSILAFTKGLDFYDLEVNNGRLVGLSRSLPPLEGGDLKGATLWVEHVTGAQYGIRVASVETTDEVVAPYDTLETYHFEWGLVHADPLPGPIPGGKNVPVPSFDGTQALCPATVEPPEGWQEWDESSHMPPFHSLVFEGDRIDAVHRTVDDTFDARWFNIACARDTLAKLRLTRHTMGTTNNHWKVVQAALKMLSADYCGDGTAFTMSGEPLVWRSPTGMELHVNPTSLEARWDEHGATCLDVPRAALTKNEALQNQFPDIEAAIAATCTRPPPCTNSDPWSYDPFDKIVSGNLDY